MTLGMLAVTLAPTWQPSFNIVSLCPARGSRVRVCPRRPAYSVGFPRAHRLDYLPRVGRRCLGGPGRASPLAGCGRPGSKLRSCTEATSIGSCRYGGTDYRRVDSPRYLTGSGGAGVARPAIVQIVDVFLQVLHNNRDKELAIRRVKRKMMTSLSRF